MANTLLTVNIGNFMSQATRDSFQDACRRWECDYTEITKNTYGFHHAGLKLKAFELVDHERILVIDADAIIRSDMPNIFELTDPSRFYAVKNQQPHLPPAYRVNTKLAGEEIARVIGSGKQVDPAFNTSFVTENFFNSGFCVASREHHEEVYKLAQYFFEGSPVQWWDQIPLNMAVNIHGGYAELSSTFNYQFPSIHGPMNQYVYHFAGDPSRYETLKKINWLAVDPRVTERERFHVLINDMGLVGVGVELGTQQGLYAKYLLGNTELFLYLVDAWRHIDGYNDIANVSDSAHAVNLSKTKHNVAPYIDRWKIIRDFSVRAADQFKDSSVDFIYIDADHSYSATMQDLRAWYPKIRAGGLIAGHDFLDGENICGSEFGVRSAVFDFLRNKTHTLYVTSEAWPSWWFIKS